MVSRGVVMLKTAPRAFPNSSPTGRGGCEPWQSCAFLLLLHTACGGAVVEPWWGCGGAVVGPCCDMRDGDCKGSFLPHVVSCLQGCAAQPK